ncbi:MAG: hypothetical protein NTV34_10135, partial [Proteobacteria bacterium]|nr:hypothetical protein [Pseudomonadota bacterium]
STEFASRRRSKPRGAYMFRNFFISESIVKSRLASAQNEIKEFNAVGIPVVMRADSGCWPILPQMFHGYTSIR